MPPRWVVTCPQCSADFTHTLISTLATGPLGRDPFASPPKPNIPAGGTQMECENCGKTSTYRIVDLRYRPN